MSHTPGPWVVEQDSGNEGEAEVISSANRTICWTADTWDGKGEALITTEDRANGRVIAAAPDLLEALSDILELYDNGQIVIEGDDGNDPVIANARKAIGKVKLIVPVKL
jgi:hypothetical protein